MSIALFYNGLARSAALGSLTKDDFVTEQTYAGGSLARWSHIIRQARDLLGGVSEDRFLFYQEATGAGAIAVAAGADLTTTTSFGPGSFGTWTHIVSAGPYLLFYNRDSGAGCVGRLDQAGFTTLKNLPQGSFGTWTHIVSAAPYLLFYNHDTGAGCVGRLDQTGFTSLKSFAESSLGVWTHIVAGEPRYRSEAMPGVQLPSPVGGIGQPGGGLDPATIAHADGGSLLFYNITTGAGAIGVLGDDDLTTVQSFAAESFGHWTILADAAAVVNPYAVAWQQKEELYASYQVVRSGASIKLLSRGGESQVDLSQSALSPEQREAALQQIEEQLKAFIASKADDIKEGRLKAVDIGGAVYGTAALVIVWIFAPFAAAGPLAAFIAKPFAAAAAQVGRYYGAAVDDLVALLKGESNESLKQIAGVLATVALSWEYAPGLMAAALLGGADAWSLTKQIGEQIGDSVASGVDALVSAVGDAVEAVETVPGDIIDTLGDLF